MKTVVSITGIRPDFIRMKEIFNLLDKNFKHILIHSGQHYSRMLSDIFFKELNIRKPDYNLNIGSKKNEHFHQLGNLSIKIIELLRKEKIKPDLIVFLGDSNSVASSISLKKEGYKIAHIEAGMRSYDKRMLEEINRTICDHCSDFNFVYHKDYKTNLLKENIPNKNIFIVGNTIKEVVLPIKNELVKKKKLNNFILADIHRPENFKYEIRLKKILRLLNDYKRYYDLPVYLIAFSRTVYFIDKYKCNLGEIRLSKLMSFKEYLKYQYNSFLIVSDSGTAQEEPAILNTPVITPRDFTERPQSMKNNCSFLFRLDNYKKSFKNSIKYIDKVKNNKIKINSTWLGTGETSKKIIKILNEKL